MDTNRFEATSRYGGPVEAWLDNTDEGIDLSVGEDQDNYSYMILSWADAERLRDWLTAAINAR